ncbi:MAG: hypothetical protein PHO37_08625 [Kiritimatiellae bacterium]|nr:hypothetical protein [Kiritimatiellia bacterium]
MITIKLTQPRLYLLCVLIGSATLSVGAQAAPLPATRDEILPDLVSSADSTYRAVNTSDKTYGVRALFTSMLAYAEANTNLNRIVELFNAAEAMQERRAEHSKYGNFYWYSTETEVHDANAVDFCMQHAMLLWRFHREKLDPEIRKRFLEMITLGVHALKAHLPRSTYTNIALLNASDLILLGEVLHDQVAVDEGTRRLNNFIKTVWEQGVSEYVSSTYYGIDLEAVSLLHELSQSESTRQSAGIILELFWHDIALNWSSQAEILAGTGSRTYDYLYNRGELDQMLTAAGWLKRPQGADRKIFKYRIFTPLYSGWSPPASLYQLSTTRFPRSVQQIYGDENDSARTHYLYQDITLSTSGSSRGERMNIPLSVDLPQTRSQLKPRLYFIADGRNDPYGKKRITAGNHSKALHLDPWWAAAQHKADALGVVLYPEKTLAEVTDGLQSHLVFRKTLDALYVDHRKLDISRLPSSPCVIALGQPIFLREGNTAIGMRIPWAQGQGRVPVLISIVDDGNPYGALRLTISHPVQSLEKSGGVESAGAAFQLRIGSEISTDQQFADFREQFAASPAQAVQKEGQLSLKCDDVEQKLSISAINLLAPVSAFVRPLPTAAVLALDGDDIGRAILERSPVVQEYVKNKTTPVTIAIKADSATTWSVLKGAYTVPIEKATDKETAYLWSPEPEGARLSNAGKISWQIKVAKAGKYAIEAHILAPTPEDDSFFISVADAAGNPVINEFAWSTGVGPAWRWSRVIDREPTPGTQLFDLPAGDLRLTFRTREAGIKLSQLRLVPQ